MQRDDSWGRGKRSELVYRAFDGVLLVSVTFDVLLPALQKLDHHRGNDKFDQLIVDAQFGLNQKIEVVLVCQFYLDLLFILFERLDFD